MKRLAAVLCLYISAVLAVCMSACGAETEKDLTLMVYMCGSDLESMSGAATADIAEMLRSKYDSECVNIILMAGGTTKWWSRFPTDVTSIYDVSGSRPQLITGDELLDMGESGTLSTLLNFGYENYPAEKYALILWDHGGGPMEGVCWDMVSASDNLTIREVQDALDNSPFSAEPLEWIGFDACLMSSIEMAHVLTPYAHYMISSQETEPGYGWSYSFLNGIEKDENGAQTGKRIIESYFEGAKGESDALTLSCMDLSQTDAVEDAMDSFFSDLTVSLNEETFSALSGMRQGAKGFGRSDQGSNDRDLADLTDLVRHYAPQSPEKAEALLAALEEMTVDNRSSIENSNGISVYHPFYNKDYYQEKWHEEYTSLFFCPGYTNYLEEFSRIWLGEELGDWSRMFEPQQKEEEENLFSVQLTEEQMQTFGSAQMIVLNGFTDFTGEGEPSYAQVYVTDDVHLDESGVLSAVYTGQTLYAVNDSGEVLTNALEYQIVDGQILVYANYSNEETGERYYTYHLCEKEENGYDLKILSTYVYDEQIGAYTNRLLPDPSAYQNVIFPFSLRFETRDENGILLPYSDWEKDSNRYRWMSFPNTEKWHFRFFDEQLGAEPLYVTFQVSDSQASVHGTQLLKVEHKGVKEISFSEEEQTFGPCRMRCSGQLIDTEITRGLDLALEFTNEGETPVRIEQEGNYYVLNGTRATDSGGSIFEELGPGETTKDYVSFRGPDLIGMDQIMQIDFSLKLTDMSGPEDEDEAAESFPVSLKLENALFRGTGFDETAPGPGESEETPEETAGALARTENGEVLAELISLEQTRDHFLKGILHVVNRSEEDFEEVYDSLIADDIELELYSCRVSVGSGMEGYYEFQAKSDWYDYNFSFDHYKGEYLFLEPDVLWNEGGLAQLHTLWFTGSTGDSVTGDLRFELDTPWDTGLPDEKEAPADSEAAADGGENEVESLTDGKAPADGGENGDEGLLYGDDRLKILLRSVGILDDHVVLQLDSVNQSDENIRYSFREPSINSVDSDMTLSGPYERIAWANSHAREYEDIHQYITAENPEALGDTASQCSLMLVVSGDGGEKFTRITLTFPPETKWNVEGGLFLEASGISVETETLDESGSKLLETSVGLPEDAASLRKQLRVQTPETSSRVESVTALIVEWQDKARFETSSGDVPEGEIAAVLARVDLHPDGEEGCYTGTYSGLLPEVSGKPALGFTFEEDGSDGTSAVLSLPSSSSVSVFPKPEYSDSFTMYLEFNVAVDYETNTAVIQDYGVKDIYSGDAEKDYSSWPASRFKGVADVGGAANYIENEDGTLESGGEFWMLDNGSLEPGENGISLSLVPAGETADDPEVIYLITCADGSVIRLKGEL